MTPDDVARLRALLAVLPERLYATADGRWGCDWPGTVDPDDLSITTISHAPEVLGWENDAGCPGYGLPRPVAEAIVELHRLAPSLLDAVEERDRLREGLEQILGDAEWGSQRELARVVVALLGRGGVGG